MVYRDTGDRYIPRADFNGDLVMAFFYRDILSWNKV